MVSLVSQNPCLVLIVIGLWLSTSFTTDYDENTVAGFLEGMKERDIPLEVFHYVSSTSWHNI